MESGDMGLEKDLSFWARIRQGSHVPTYIYLGGCLSAIYCASLFTAIDYVHPERWRET
jgi:hypothetical protein